MWNVKVLGYESEEGRTVKARTRVRTIMAKKTIEATMRTIEVVNID